MTREPLQGPRIPLGFWIVVGLAVISVILFGVAVAVNR